MPLPRTYIRSERELVTPDGLELLADYPDVGEVFRELVVSATAERQYYRANGEYSFVGQGCYSTVLGLPGYEDMFVVKLATPWSGMSSNDTSKVTPKNLITELQFMDVLGNRLSLRPEANISVPAQYMAIRTAGGNYGSLQQRLPTRLVNIDTYLRSLDEGRRDITIVSGILKGRFYSALGSNMLRLAMSDFAFYGRSGTVHGSNVWLELCKPPEETEMQVIDLVNSRERIAKLVTLLAMHGQTSTHAQQQ